MSKNEELKKRLEEMKKNNGQKSNAADMIGGIVSQEEEKTDFEKIAQELEAMKEEKKSVLTGTVKDTIYIDKPIHDAIKALCVKQGDKRRIVNEALSDYVKKRYKELKK